MADRDGEDVGDPNALLPPPEAPLPEDELRAEVGRLLGIDEGASRRLIDEAERLYKDRMTTRFSDLKTAERIKRTNPFLLRIRGAKTVRVMQNPRSGQRGPLVQMLEKSSDTPH